MYTWYMQMYSGEYCLPPKMYRPQATKVLLSLLKCPTRANNVATSINSTPTASNGVDSL